MSRSAGGAFVDDDMLDERADAVLAGAGGAASGSEPAALARLARFDADTDDEPVAEPRPTPAGPGLFDQFGEDPFDDFVAPPPTARAAKNLRARQAKKERPTNWAAVATTTSGVARPSRGARSTRCSTTATCGDCPGEGPIPSGPMAEALDIDAMIARFQERARAVKQRPLPPVAGEERSRFIQQAQADFRDFAMVGDAVGTIEDGFLVLRVDLRPADQRG